MGMGVTGIEVNRPLELGDRGGVLAQQGRDAAERKMGEGLPVIQSDATLTGLQPLRQGAGGIVGESEHHVEIGDESKARVGQREARVPLDAFAEQPARLLVVLLRIFV